MTNLDSILKSRDITLQSLYHQNYGFFPVVMCGCENWTIKKAECQKNLCFQTVVLEKTLENPLDSKEIKLVNFLKEINPEYSLEGLMLKLQYFGHVMQRANPVE